MRGSSNTRNAGSNTFPMGFQSKLPFEDETPRCSVGLDAQLVDAATALTTRGSSGEIACCPTWLFGTTQGSKKSRSASDYPYSSCAIGEKESMLNRRPRERNISAQAGIKYSCSAQATQFTAAIYPRLCRSMQRPDMRIDTLDKPHRL